MITTRKMPRLDAQPGRINIYVSGSGSQRLWESQFGTSDLALVMASYETLCRIDDPEWRIDRQRGQHGGVAIASVVAGRAAYRDLDHRAVCLSALWILLNGPSGEDDAAQFRAALQQTGGVAVLARAADYYTSWSFTMISAPQPRAVEQSEPPPGRLH